MNEFVIGGLDTPQKRQEAEVILKQLGYYSDEDWNRGYRNHKMFDFIKCENGFVYEYHTQDCGETPITLEELRTKIK
jgi:hypothetical protein